MLTPEELAERMKSEILADIRNGIVPPAVAEFSQLHDYVDANCYGGTEQLLEELEKNHPSTDAGGHAALMELCDLMNPAIEIVDSWLRTGGAISRVTFGPLRPESGDSCGSVIPSTADRAADEANMEAIDRLVRTDRYRYIIAWGKWLGFTPESVRAQVAAASADNAPADAIQKIDGKWSTLDDIENPENRQAVESLAAGRQR